MTVQLVTIETPHCIVSTDLWALILVKRNVQDCQTDAAACPYSTSPASEAFIIPREIAPYVSLKIREVWVQDWKKQKESENIPWYREYSIQSTQQKDESEIKIHNQSANTDSEINAKTKEKIRFGGLFDIKHKLKVSHLKRRSKKSHWNWENRREEWWC